MSATGQDKPIQEPTNHPKPTFDWIWNILTGLLIFIFVILIAAMGLIYKNPSLSINPFPPPTLPVLIVLPSDTPTTPSLPPTGTPTITLTPAPSSTPLPPTATPTMIGRGPTPTASDTPSVKSLYPFILQAPAAAIDVSSLNPDRDHCSWMGVGGQAVDLKGSPVTGILVQVGGSLGGYVLSVYPSLTGTALKYGQGGYEVTLADKPTASTGTLWIQLLDQQRLPLSGRVYFDTYEDCTKDLTIINFKQVR